MERDFYIPTSSLNFNNIVSSECISPAAFYSQREFGLRRFVDIFDGRYKNNIIMADRVAGFSRPMSDVEDHPMLVKAVLDESEVKSIGEGFYTIDKTINITPYNTSFIFLSEQDRLVAESLSEHSIEVKLSQLYVPRMMWIQPKEHYDFSKIHSLPNNENTIKNVKLDERKNRLKGMLYGYYAGAMLSANRTDMEKLGILFSVRDEFSAIISSGAKVLNRENENRLRELSSQWSMLSPLYLELKDAKIDVLTLTNILQKYGVKLPFNNLGLRRFTDFLLHQTLEGENNPAIEWIEQSIDNQLLSIKKSATKIQTDDSEIIVDGENLVGISCGKLDLAKHWFNTVLLNSEKCRMESYDKMTLADMVTDATIDLLGDGWKGSTERVFLNKLRKHIAGEAFDVEWDNGLLSSIAAVVLRGSEWEELLLFMQRKGMYDYRLAFAMYGALTGYANMSRLFVDPLYDDKQYGWQVYKEIYGQLFGKDISITIKQAPEVMLSEPNKHHIEEKNTQKSMINSYGEDNNAVEDIIRKITGHQDYKDKYNSIIPQIRQRRLTDWDEIAGLGKWKGFIDKVRPKKNQPRIHQRKDTIETLNLFGLRFCDDKNVWEKIRNLVPNDGYKNSHGKNRLELIREDLEWFQHEVLARNPKYGYDKINPDNNREVIEKFYCLKQGKDKDGREKAPYYTPELRKAIKQRLLSLYCGNE